MFAEVVTLERFSPDFDANDSCVTYAEAHLFW
jgi:hypothetical protein